MSGAVTNASITGMWRGELHGDGTAAAKDTYPGQPFDYPAAAVVRFRG